MLLLRRLPGSVPGTLPACGIAAKDGRRGEVRGVSHSNAGAALGGGGTKATDFDGASSEEWSSMVGSLGFASRHSLDNQPIEKTGKNRTRIFRNSQVILALRRKSILVLVFGRLLAKGGMGEKLATLAALLLLAAVASQMRVRASCRMWELARDWAAFLRGETNRDGLPFVWKRDSVISGRVARQNQLLLAAQSVESVQSERLAGLA